MIAIIYYQNAKNPRLSVFDEDQSRVWYNYPEGKLMLPGLLHR